MTLETILQWLSLPILGGIAWLSRSISALEVTTKKSEDNITSLWHEHNKLVKEISDVGKSVAAIEGELKGKREH